MHMFLDLHILNGLISSSSTGRDRNARNMGKKGSWFSAIKRVFLPHSKEKLGNVSLYLMLGKQLKKMLTVYNLQFYI